MRVRPVKSAAPQDLDRFIEAGGEPENREETRNYLKKMFSAGSMRPEWCFVAGDEGRTLGRVAFWTLPGVEEPFALVLLDVDGEEDFASVGGEMLEEILGLARDLGSREIEHVLDDPPMSPQFQSRLEERISLLESAGFSQKRETDRFEWDGGEPPTTPDRLRFQTLEEVGEESFIEAMARVSSGTLDREILSEIESLGPERAAREFFDDARRVEHDPAWWQMAYKEESGDLAGLVMPAHPPAFATIFYVGVVPQMRGRGYVNDLLAVGTSTLLTATRESGAPLRADTDVSNAPMAAAFERGGWRRFAKRREYGIKLAPSE